jgi:4-hydroxy-tetrahydrodipicolinate synthase
MPIAKGDLKAWARERFRGIQNLIFPSFTPDLSELDEDGIRWDVQQTIQHGFFSTHCAVEAGLSLDEAVRFVQIVADEAKDKLIVSTTVIFDSFEKNIAFLQRVEHVGCHLALIGYPPNYYPVSTEEVFTVTKRMCEATNLAVNLYPSHKFNFMRFQRGIFPLDVLARAVMIPNVVAVECTIIEPGTIYETFNVCGEQALVQVPQERWLPLMTAHYHQQWMGPGAYELYQSPDQPMLVDCFNLMLADKMEQAMALYWKLTPIRLVFEKQFMPTIGIGMYHWPQQKYYQWLTGGNGGFTRQPVMRLYQQDMDECRKALQSVGLSPNENDEEFFVGKTNYAKGLRLTRN